MSEYIVNFLSNKVDDFVLHERIIRCKDCCLQDEFKYCERLGFKVGDYGYCAWWGKEVK